MLSMTILANICDCLGICWHVKDTREWYTISSGICDCLGLIEWLFDLLRILWYSHTYCLLSVRLSIVLLIVW